MTEDAVELPQALERVAPAAVAKRTDVSAETARAVLETLDAIERDERPWRDPDVLHRLYYEEGLDQVAIADRLGCGQKTVSRQMKRHDIAPGRGAKPAGATILAAMDADDIPPTTQDEERGDGAVARLTTDGGGDGRE